MQSCTDVEHQLKNIIDDIRKIKNYIEKNIGCTNDEFMEINQIESDLSRMITSPDVYTFCHLRKLNIRLCVAPNVFGICSNLYNSADLKNDYFAIVPINVEDECIINNLDIGDSRNATVFCKCLFKANTGIHSYVYTVHNMNRAVLQQLYGNSDVVVAEYFNKFGGAVVSKEKSMDKELIYNVSCNNTLHQFIVTKTA